MKSKKKGTSSITPTRIGVAMSCVPRLDLFLVLVFNEFDFLWYEFWTQSARVVGLLDVA